MTPLQLSLGQRRSLTRRTEVIALLRRRLSTSLRSMHTQFDQLGESLGEVVEEEILVFGVGLDEGEESLVLDKRHICSACRCSVSLSRSAQVGARRTGREHHEFFS